MEKVAEQQQLDKIRRKERNAHYALSNQIIKKEIEEKKNKEKEIQLRNDIINRQDDDIRRQEILQQRYVV